MLDSVISTSVPALDKVMRLLNYISDNPGKNFSQIQEALQLPRSSTSSLLKALALHNLIRKEKNLFYLGIKLTTLGNNALEQIDICKVAQPILSDLQGKTHLTCHLGVLKGLSAIYLLKVESNQPISINTWVGKNLSLHSSGIGKALCAWLSSSEIDRIFTEEKLTQFTDHTILTKSELLRELETVRKEGLAYDRQEDAIGVHCIAAPIFDNHHKVVAAISMSGINVQLTDSHNHFAKLLLNATDKIHQILYS